MAAPTNTYVDYATGNDYKGASFVDGAYTSATKTLIKANAFTASKVNHWLWLESNDGGSIVTGYYKIATWTDASTVILATDAGAGVDDDAAKCTQHDGTTAKPWRSVQGALDLITRDATNGDQINVKAGTAQVNQGALTLATYGTPGAGIPLVFRGYTSSANDGGMAELDCGGFGALAANNYSYVAFVDLEIHSAGNNNTLDFQGAGNGTLVYHCKIHKGASTPSSKVLIAGYYDRTNVVNCWVYNAGTNGIGIGYIGACRNNYVKDCATGISACSNAINNLVVDCATGINAGPSRSIVGNAIYSSTANTGKGILASGTNHMAVILNNVIAGYSGAGGIGISATADVELIGYNAFYNNTTPKSLADVIVDLGSDVTCAASPFIDAVNGNFAVTAELKAKGFPAAWYEPAATTNYLDIGAVQRSEPAAAQVIEAGGGTYHVTAAAEVLDTVSFGAASAETGTYHAPDPGEVIDTAVFGPASGTAGTFAVPAEADVKDGVMYGEDGTEFEGELAAGGGGPVIGSAIVRGVA